MIRVSGVGLLVLSKVSVLIRLLWLLGLLGIMGSWGTNVVRFIRTSRSTRVIGVFVFGVSEGIWSLGLPRLSRGLVIAGCTRVIWVIKFIWVIQEG